MSPSLPRPLEAQGWCCPLEPAPLAPLCPISHPALAHPDQNLPVQHLRKEGWVKQQTQEMLLNLSKVSCGCVTPSLCSSGALDPVLMLSHQPLIPAHSSSCLLQETWQLSREKCRHCQVASPGAPEGWGGKATSVLPLPLPSGTALPWGCAVSQPLT